MKIAKPTSAHFRERARHYRLAEAIADAPRDVEMFHDLATMFKRLSEDFARMVHGRSGASALDGVRGPADGRHDGARSKATTLTSSGALKRQTTFMTSGLTRSSSKMA